MSATRSTALGALVDAGRLHRDELRSGAAGRPVTVWRPSRAAKQVAYGRLRWSSWGARQAEAKGRQCSARTGGCRTASIRLFGRRTIRGRDVYTCLRPLRAVQARICLLNSAP